MKSKTIHAPTAVPEVDSGLEATGILHTDLVKVAVPQDISLAGHSAHGQGHPPVRLHRALDNGWNHGHAPQPPGVGAKPAFR